MQRRATFVSFLPRPSPSSYWKTRFPSRKKPDLIMPKVMKRIEALRELQRQHDELVAKATKGMPGAPHAEHQSLCEAIFNKRFEIVNGIVEVDSVKNESAEEAKINDLTIEVKGIPDFWMTVLKNSEIYEIAEAGE
ncbi:nucleosome assembly protein 1;2-like isoform X1 [Tasmannia lanceolata]|uniref:nucleosome assembly protein 1;2-like isoform X1 n=1 Tax=Tasmannia lanceolata TaxID=3420 RepID=UPI0040646E3D